VDYPKRFRTLLHHFKPKKIIRSLVRFSHRLGESMRKPLWTHGVASKVLRPRFNRAQKITPVVQMKKPICTTASARAFLIGDEKCGLEQVLNLILTFKSMLFSVSQKTYPGMQIFFTPVWLGTPCNDARFEQIRILARSCTAQFEL